jgi:hypothetical protein
MNVHLLRSSEFDKNAYLNVLNLIQGIPGTFKFIASETSYEIKDENDDLKTRKFKDKEEFTTREAFVSKSLNYEAAYQMPHFPLERRIITWDMIFNLCRRYRKANDVGDDEAVILLTDLTNKFNWFSGWENDALNFFVHTEDWGFYLGQGIDIQYPVAYEIASNLLQKLMFDTVEETSAYAHRESIGCTMDFCETKTDIILKLRTGDICEACLGLIEKRRIPVGYRRHIFDILDGVRMAMTFRGRSRLLKVPSQLVVRGRMKQIFLTDFGDLQVRLNPTERSLYLLFLNHAEGIPLQNLRDYRDELLGIYLQLSNQSNREAMIKTVDRLTDPLENNLNVALSRIRSKFLDAVGEELLKNYIIDGDRGEAKSIALDRGLLSYEM